MTIYRKKIFTCNYSFLQDNTKAVGQNVLPHSDESVEIEKEDQVSAFFLAFLPL